MNTQSVKVSRAKLLARLKEIQVSDEARFLEEHPARRDRRIAQIEEYIQHDLARCAERTREIERIKSGSDFKYEPDRSLEKAVRLLELSDEETITVRASSDVYKYL